MTEIRSYRRVFDLERRIYRVDRLRLNPGGIPVRGVVYFLAILTVTLLAGRVPLLAAIARSLPWYLRDLAFPGLAAAVLALIRVEGRPFHLAAHALVRYRCGARTLAGARPCHTGSICLPGERWRMEDLLMLPDGSEAVMRRFRYTGPGALLIAVAHRREVKSVLPGCRASLLVHQLPGVPRPPRGEVVLLERTGRLIVR